MSRLGNKIDAVYSATLNAREQAKKVARISFVGACALVAYRCGNDLPSVNEGRDGDGVIRWRSASPTEAADLAIEYGEALAKRLAEFANHVWKG